VTAILDFDWIGLWYTQAEIIVYIGCHVWFTNYLNITQYSQFVLVLLPDADNMGLSVIGFSMKSHLGLQLISRNTRYSWVRSNILDLFAQARKMGIADGISILSNLQAQLWGISGLTTVILTFWNYKTLFVVTSLSSHPLKHGRANGR